MSEKRRRRRRRSIVVRDKNHTNNKQGNVFN
jgi:hypothetical protein